VVPSLRTPVTLPIRPCRRTFALRVPWPDLVRTPGRKCPPGGPETQPHTDVVVVDFVSVTDLVDSLSSLGWRGFTAADLERRAAEIGPRFQSAEPFPHVVIDGLLPQNVLDAMLQEFPSAEAMAVRRNTAQQVKLANRDWELVGPVTKMVLSEFRSGMWLDFLTKVTGVEKLLADPYMEPDFQHQIQTGGYLRLHYDELHHTRMRLFRRLAFVFYLNEDWDPSWGGQLELWDEDVKHCVHRVEPIANRTVVFLTTQRSWHGHPDPLTCPVDVTRKSFALWYWTVDRPPSSEWGGVSSLQYRRRPGTDDPALREMLDRAKLVEMVTPPILRSVARRAKRKVLDVTNRSGSIDLRNDTKGY
jgi:Rps23 Pro-64 3,4-dihydroxylase Tpa1-like proline 4-hydroxylase